MNKLNVKLTEEIIRRIPSGIKPVDYLADSLNTSRESAYRRLRNEIPFTFNEITQLAGQLNFSMDEIIGIDKQGRIFMDFHIDAYANPDKNFHALFREYAKFIENVSKARNQDIIISSNKISLLTLMKYDTLFKFFYFKYIHQTQEMFFNSCFSDITIPSEIAELRQRFIENMAELDSVTAIYGKDLFLSMIRDIKYYYSRELLSKTEVSTLKTELLTLLEQLTKLMQTGSNDTGKRKMCYLSLLDIETNCEHAAYDGKNFLIYWIYSINFLSITDPELCMVHQKRFEAMKKTAVLLSRSNEILQGEFLEKQQQHIESITNDMI
jgi:hypothetical protein